MVHAVDGVYYGALGIARLRSQISHVRTFEHIVEYLCSETELSKLPVLIRCQGKRNRSDQISEVQRIEFCKRWVRFGSDDTRGTWVVLRNHVKTQSWTKEFYPVWSITVCHTIPWFHKSLCGVLNCHRPPCPLPLDPKTWTSVYLNFMKKQSKVGHAPFLVTSTRTSEGRECSDNSGEY